MEGSYERSTASAKLHGLKINAKLSVCKVWRELQLGLKRAGLKRVTAPAKCL
jgi:hypothetical protein